MSYRAKKIVLYLRSFVVIGNLDICFNVLKGTKQLSKTLKCQFKLDMLSLVLIGLLFMHLFVVYV